MKKTLFFSLILTYSLIFKSLGATNNSLGKPYKILERKSPEKHFTVNKDNLMEIFSSEPKNAIVELEIPYLNTTQKFELERLDIRGEDNLGMTYTTSGHFFTTKLYNGLSYNINDFNNINMGTMTIYPNNVYINLRVNGEEIKIEKEFNTKITHISKNEINDKTTEDFKNIKDIISKIDKIKNEKILTKSDISAMKEVKDFDIKKEKESQQTFKQFKNDELLAPAPPPSNHDCEPLVYTRCQVILVNYMISYEMYLKWQTPTFIIENGKLTLKEGSIKKSYNQTAVTQVTQKLTNYFTQVVNIFKNEGINVQLGKIVVETEPLETYQKDFTPEQGALDNATSEVVYDIKHFKNQYLRGNREWKGWQSPYSEADDGAFKDIPKGDNDFYNGGNYSNINLWSCGRTNTSGVHWGLHGLFDVFNDYINSVADNDTAFTLYNDRWTGKVSEKLTNANYFAKTPFIRIRQQIGPGLFGPTYGQSLKDFYDGFWFYIGDITPATTNENPAMSWKEFIRNENARANIIKYSGQNFANESNDWNGNNFTGWSMNMRWGNYNIPPGTFNHNNYLPMLVAPKDISDDNVLNLPNPSSYNSTLFGNIDPFVYYYDLSKKMPVSYQNIKVNGFDEVGAHLQSIGVSHPYISYPTKIYGLPNNTKFETIPDRTGIIPLLGNMWYHTYDLENVNTKYFDVLTNTGDWKNGDAINYKQYPMHKIIYDGDEIATDTVLQWNYQDVQELYGTTGQFGNSNHLAYNIDKWNIWMLVHHIAIKLGPRYFTTTTNRNTILAPLARNYNYNADNYTYAPNSGPEGTPHISERAPSEKNVPGNTTWLRHWFQTYLYPSFATAVSEPTDIMDLVWGNLGNALITAGIFVPLRIKFASKSTIRGNGENWWWNGYAHWFGNDDDKNLWHNGTTMTVTWVVLAVYIAATMATQGASFGWSREDLVPPIVGYQWPYIYRKHIQSTNSSGDYNYDEDDWDKKGNLLIGWQSWDARYSMWDLKLVDNMCPVDLVSFSKGFDKKTGDLIRLNLMGEEISGHGPNVNNCNCTTDPNCVRGNGLIRGRPNPYATVSLWHKRNVLSPTFEYQFYGDTLFARNNVLGADYPSIETNVVNEGNFIVKNNSLTTEQQIDESDNLTNLDNWYGTKMKVQSRYEALDRPGGSRFDSTGYTWRFNNSVLSNANGNFPFTGLAGIPRARNKSRARILIPTSNDSLMRIYPVTLTMTDTNGCTSNNAVKYIRVYPRKELPVRNSFIQKISPSSGALFTPYIPFGFLVSAFGLKSGTSRIKYDQFNLNTKNLYGTRTFGMRNWEFIGPWSTGEGNGFNEASTYMAGYYNRGMKPWSPSRFSNTGWSMANLSTSLDPFYSGRAAVNEHPVFHRNAYQNSRFNQSSATSTFNYSGFQYASYVDNWSDYSSLFYFPIRSDEQAKQQYTVGDPNIADPRFDKSYNYGLGQDYGGGVFFKNEHRPFYPVYVSRDKPWNNWAFNLYEYYRGNGKISVESYVNNDDEGFQVSNIGGGRLPSNAKSPIKYFYGRDRLFGTNKIIDLGARNTYGGINEFVSDHSNMWLGQGPEQWAHSSSWFHERDYVFINRTRANRVFPGIFSEGREFYRLRPIIQTPPFNINFYDPITRINNTYDFWTLSYLWGTNDVQFDNEDAIRADYDGETRKRNYKAIDYLNNEFNSLKSLPNWASLTNFRVNTSDTARSPLYLNNQRQNNYLKFRLSYSYFVVPDTGIVYYYPATGSPYIKWNTSTRAGASTGGDKIEIWVRGTTQNGTPRRSLIFEGNLKDMSSYKGKTNFKFDRFGNPISAFNGDGGGNYTLGYDSELTPNYHNTQKRIRPGYVLAPTFLPSVEYDSIPTPIGTVAWFPAYPKNVYTGEIEPVKIYHKPMAEYLRSPIPGNNKYYKNTVDWSDIRVDIRNFDDCENLQFDVIYKNIGGGGISSSLILGSMEIVSGRSLPLELCEGGDPTLQITNAVNDTIPLNPNVDPEDRVGNWRLTSSIPNNVYKYTVNLIKTDNTRQLLKSGVTEQTYSIDDNEIKKADGTFVGPILSEGFFQTTPGNQYNLEAILENVNTVNINGNIFNETEPQIITTSVTTYQKRLPKKKPRFNPDSAFNFDANFSLVVNFFPKSNIENFTLQRGTVVTTPTGESDTTWQNVGQTLTYTNCTPAMPSNVKFFNYNVACSYKFNLTNIPNGLHLYRLRYTSLLDNPTVEFTGPISIAVCTTCSVPLGNLRLYVKNSDSLTPNGQIPQLSDESDFNYGNYNLYLEIKSPKPGELNNTDFVDLFEQSQTDNGITPFTFKKRINITQLYDVFLQADSIKNKKQGGYVYILRGYSAANNISYPLQNSNFIQVKADYRPCFPSYSNIEAFTDILNFDLKSSCPLTKYKVLLYKLENKTTSGVDSNGNEISNIIEASNPNLTEDLVRNLNVNSTPISRFQNDEIPDGTMRFTQQERLNKMFSRLINPRPAVLNNWYRIDIICTACPSGSTQNIKSIYYYFNE